ncbi:MAG TPA: tudor domain-containing protein [Stellaceae bacterium]|jgi:hypothetical protein|nr:tudor domain-containing protein [Stellaceae bacterium]
MSSTRIVGLTAAASVALFALSLPALADGLSRFEQKIKPQLPPGALTYKSAKGLGDNGFVLEDVVFTPPPDATQGAKAEPIAIKRVSVDDLDFAAIDKNAPPNFAKMRAEGIVISAKPAAGVDLSQLAGLDKVTADFQLDYRLDPAQKTMTLNRLELDLNGLARMELSMVLDNVSAADAGKSEAAMNDATLRTASFVFEDRSLLSKVLPAAAKMQSVEPDALVTVAKTMIDGMRAGLAPPTLAVFDAVESYMDDYKQPKGALRITLNPPSKVTGATISAIKTPDEAVKQLGLVVSYPGTRPQGPPAGATPAAPAVASASGGAGCTPGARYFVMHEDAYWSVTVREAAGDKCSARIDGGSADDNVTFGLDKTLTWTIDGPGKAVAKCKGGDKVLVENDGGWYPAKVIDKPFADGQCPVKFESTDGDEDTVELKRVRRLD